MKDFLLVLLIAFELVAFFAIVFYNLWEIFDRRTGSTGIQKPAEKPPRDDDDLLPRS